MNIKYKTMKQITITGDMKESQEALNYCYRNDYRTRRSGPMPIAKYKYDVNRFRIIAEKQVIP
jgi:hypothetical protein